MSETIERRELIQPEPARALAALLEVEDPTKSVAPHLPLTWHWIHLLDRPARSDIGPDGHPVRGTLPRPPAEGQRRMWAGGSVVAHGQLRLGVLTTRRSEVLSSVDKQGSAGPLTFVTVGHQILQDEVVVVEERQDVLYRPAPPTRIGPAPGGPEGIGPPVGGWRIPVDSPFLFRYSALTYNGHRIHYDRDYARDVEGYPGLLVHGPLQATCMAEAARAAGWNDDRLRFDYRLVSPLFDHQGMVVCADPTEDGCRTLVTDAAGRTTAEGTIIPL